MPLKDMIDPSGFATLLFLAGVTALLVRRLRHWALPILAASATVLIVFSSGLVAALLLGPLENSHPALRNPQLYPQAKVIAVLTAYAIQDPELPMSAQMNGPSAHRVLEAANLWAARPDCTVVVTGSSPTAQIMASQLRSLGIPGDLMIVDGASDSTAASAQYVRSITGGGPVFLVTSAGHMRRALGTFRHRGLAPIPAPTDYRLPRNPADSLWSTSPAYLQASDLAFHEYLGIAWYRLTDRL
jgi:uncharacterized SAM-binding protein YcdF (DUF218 family)